MSSKSPSISIIALGAFAILVVLLFGAGVYYNVAIAAGNFLSSRCAEFGGQLSWVATDDGCETQTDFVISEEDIEVIVNARIYGLKDVERVQEVVSGSFERKIGRIGSYGVEKIEKLASPVGDLGWFALKTYATNRIFVPYTAEIYGGIGRCIFSVDGGNRYQGSLYGDYHYYENDAWVDLHPGYDHGKNLLINNVSKIAGELINIISATCANEQKEGVGVPTPARPAEELPAVTELPQDFDLYEDCKSQCTAFQETASKAYCDQRQNQESKNQCYQDLGYATEQCLHGCYINWSPEQMQLRAQEGVRISGSWLGGNLSINLPSAYEMAVARVKEKTVEELRGGGSFLRIDTLDGKQIEVDVTDIPTEPPPTPEESFGGLAITQEAQELINRWQNPEGTLIYNKKSKRYRSLEDILRESRNEGSCPWESTQPLYQAPPQTIAFGRDSKGKGGCYPEITFGIDGPWDPFADSELIVTVPEARQMIKIQDTSMAILPNSRVALNGPNSVELLQGVVEIQRGATDELSLRAGATFTVTARFASVTSEKTHFWVAHNPLKGYTLVGVREGKVSMTHAFTGETTSLEPQENGGPGIVVLLQPDIETKKSGALVWIIVILIAGGLGYLVYRKRSELSELLKGE